MEPSLESLSAEWKKRNIRLSYQRIKVLEYLTKYKSHPTVDQIYCNLLHEVTTLSKTTVYNTLGALIDADLVRVITTEDNEKRYDIKSNDHGHFKCEKCGTIFDFNIKIADIAADDLDGFKVNQKNVYFKGVCPRCLSK